MKNINEAQVLCIDSKSTNNPQVITNAFNEYFLSLVKKKCVNNDDGDDGNDSSSSSSSSSSSWNNNNNSNSNNNTYIPKYYLLNAFNSSFPNIKLKSATTQETENIIKYLKPKNSLV
jgi:hypothetical protein